MNWCDDPFSPLDAEISSMRIVTEAVIRGELMVMELSEQDFCPECCGVLEAAGSTERPFLRCVSCYGLYRPQKSEEKPCRN